MKIIRSELSEVSVEKQTNQFFTLFLYTQAHSIKLKYWYTCEIYRPPRSSHCGAWDACIERIDHHCPYLGTCIGKRNYKYFFIFINLLSFLIVISILLILWEIYLRVKEKMEDGRNWTSAFKSSIEASPYPLISLTIALISASFVIILCGYHHRLAWKSSTTNENLKGRYNNALSFNPNK